jgi:3-oxoacyl-[acyl-carrier-protein] synthase I
MSEAFYFTERGEGYWRVSTIHQASRVSTTPSMPLLPSVCVSACTATSALGSGKVAHETAFQAHRSGLRALASADVAHAVCAAAGLKTWVGQVEGLDTPLPFRWKHWDCRNNRLAWLGLQADGFAASVQGAVQRHGAHRVAVVLGSSTASIGATEDAYRQLATHGVFPPQPDNPSLHTLHSLSAFVQEALGLTGPSITVSTACSSSAKAFASGQRLLAMDLADAVLVGGVDTLCGSVLLGFNALQLVSPDPCRPFDRHRSGISLGEAAGFALLERSGARLRLLACGESSDAHHQTAPQPGGLGALAAIDQALARAGIGATDVDYIHAHGTATPKNDAIEAALIAQRFRPPTVVSSTKGHTGHTLGAAGALGAVFSLMALDTGRMPATVGTQLPESTLAPFWLQHPTQRTVRNAACMAFGFGGSNCVLVFGREGAPP